MVNSCVSLAQRAVSFDTVLFRTSLYAVSLSYSVTLQLYVYDTRALCYSARLFMQSVLLRQNNNTTLKSNCVNRARVSLTPHSAFLLYAAQTAL